MMSNYGLILAIIVTGGVIAGRPAHAHDQQAPSRDREKVSSQPPRDPARLWCSEHGVYEDECLLCHPELADKLDKRRERPSGQEQPAPNGNRTDGASQPPRDPTRLWCREHGVYEDECVLCHPELAEKVDESGQDHSGHNLGAGSSLGELWCNEHNVAEIECGICQPQLAARLRPGEGLKVRLPSRESAGKAGILVASPRLADIAASIKVFCEVHYNQNRLAKITPLVAGVIHSVHADVGDEVAQGDMLVELASTEVAAARRDLLAAIVEERLKRLAYERQKQLVEKEIAATQSYQEAEAEYEMAQLTTLSARQRLMNYGCSGEEVDESAAAKSSSSLVHIHAPFAGTLVERSAVVGEAGVPGSPIFTLADLSTMWLTLSVPESRIGTLQAGLPVEATFVSLPGVVISGRIAWINAAVNPANRMVEVRALIENPEGSLRDNMFGEARVFLSPAARSITVPAPAVQRWEQQPFLFVKLDEDLYELRRIELGGVDLSRVQVLRGVSPGDAVVVAGSYTMMSEFLKSRLGAGCVHD